MTPGVLLLLGALAGLGALAAVQAWAARRARALEGSALPPLPPPFDGLAHADTLLWLHSPTCGPCRAMRGDVAALREAGRLVEIDVTEHLDVARALGVMATPTTVRVRDGRVIAVRTGVLRRDALEALGGRRRPTP